MGQRKKSNQQVQPGVNDGELRTSLWLYWRGYMWFVALFLLMIVGSMWTAVFVEHMWWIAVLILAVWVPTVLLVYGQLRAKVVATDAALVVRSGRGIAVLPWKNIDRFETQRHLTFGRRWWQQPNGKWASNPGVGLSVFRYMVHAITIDGEDVPLRPIIYVEGFFMEQVKPEYEVLLRALNRLKEGPMPNPGPASGIRQVKTNHPTGTEEPLAFDSLGFMPTYACEIGPEFPGTGDWHLPTHSFAHGGSGHESASGGLVGKPLVVRYSIREAGWVGYFDTFDFGLVGVFGCPSPTASLVLAEGPAYYFDVEDPEKYAVVGGLLPVRGVARVEGEDLLIVWDWMRMVAIGVGGIAWESERLCLDDLEVVVASSDGIECEGRFGPTLPESFVVDLQSGAVAAGRKYDLPG